MFLKIGHRGASGYEPENTLRSFRRAVALGADMIELDVHLTKDGRVVVIHDDTVDRTTDGKGKVGRMTFAEIKKLDAGQGERIPTLEEALGAVVGKAAVDIEIKGEGLAGSVAKVVKERLDQGAEPEDFVISSFSRSELSGIAATLNLRKVLLTKGAPQRAITSALDLGAWGIGAPSEKASGDGIAKVHANGLKLFLWTAHEADERSAIDKYRKLGVDGIFSNFPDRL